MKEIGTTCNRNHLLELTDEEFKTFIRLKQAHAAELELRSFSFSDVLMLDHYTKTEESNSFFDKERIGKFAEREIIDEINSSLSYYFFQRDSWQPEISSKIEYDMILISVKDNDIGFGCATSLSVARIFSKNNGILDMAKGFLAARDKHVFQRQEQVNDGEQHEKR